MKNNWYKSVKVYAKLIDGENQFTITGEPYVEEGKYGERLYLPTDLGILRFSLKSPIAVELAKYRQKHPSVLRLSFTVFKTGMGRDTRYKVIRVDREHETPPRNQTVLNLDDLPEDQKQKVQQFLKSNASLIET